MGKQQTVRLFRDGHWFVFRYYDTLFGRAFLMNVLLEKEAEDGGGWTVLDTAYIAKEVLARATGYAMERVKP